MTSSFTFDQDDPRTEHLESIAQGLITQAATLLIMLSDYGENHLEATVRESSGINIQLRVDIPHEDCDIEEQDVLDALEVLTWQRGPAYVLSMLETLLDQVAVRCEEEDEEEEDEEEDYQQVPWAPPRHDGPKDPYAHVWEHFMKSLNDLK